MNQLTEKDLKAFQTRAAGEIAEMLQAYGGPRGSRFPTLYNEYGEKQPFLCRLRAVTGAGKTPTLALVTKQLGHCIILWTTNRSAVISQTHANLDVDGKYAPLLPDDAKVYTLGQMSPQDWTEVFAATTGVTILYATVASFNQDPAMDKLKIHQSGYWKRLGTEGGEDGRQRPLFVFYDEGHGATRNQFARLLELSPVAFVLASASPLPEDLAELIAGKTPEQREKSLADRTVTIPTPDVVKAGLLKTRLFLSDCNVADSDALQEANDKWHEIAAKFAQMGGDVPIAGFVVNSTERGLLVWEELVKLGVPKERIAAHFVNAEAVMTEKTGSNNGLLDTYKNKKQPEQLKDEGYTHLIWNLTLNEGWDEPMAYVAYIDDKGRSVNEMTQRIGRFVRQPNATPFDDPDLNAAYFYFNVSDSEFELLISNMQEDLTLGGTEVIALHGSERAKSSRDIAVKEIRTLPGISDKFSDDPEIMADILLRSVSSWDDEDKEAKGFIDRRVFATDEIKEDKTQRERLERDNNASVSVYEFLMGRLQQIDKRIERGRFPGTLADHKKMKQHIQFGSEAMRHLSDQIPLIRDRLQEVFRLVPKSRHSPPYIVPNFKMTSPDLVGGTELQREKYRVRSYQNALHKEYNGFNGFEVDVAEALDNLMLAWCRNPSTKNGYGIPIPYLGAEGATFYPDFFLWSNNKIWVIDPKGDHLKDDAARNKLFDVNRIPNLSTPIEIALILEGKHTFNTNNGQWTSDKKAFGYTLVRRTYAVKTQEFDNLDTLMQTLLASE